MQRGKWARPLNQDRAGRVGAEGERDGTSNNSRTSVIEEVTSRPCIADGTVERFRWVRAPTSAELTKLTHTIAERVGRFLQRQGLLECDGEQSYLAAEAVDEGTMDPLLVRSITYRITVGPQAGRKGVP